MCTKLSTKISRMSIDELAVEYALLGQGAGSYGAFSLMSMSRYTIKEEMVRRTGPERTDEAIRQATETLKMIVG